MTQCDHQVPPSTSQILNLLVGQGIVEQKKQLIHIYSIGAKGLLNKFLMEKGWQPWVRCFLQCILYCVSILGYGIASILFPMNVSTSHFTSTLELFSVSCIELTRFSLLLLRGSVIEQDSLVFENGWIS